MKNELTRLLEVDANLGEISNETAKHAKSEADGCAKGLVLSYIVSVGGLAASLGCLLGGCAAVGSSFGVIGVFFLFASRYFRRQMEKYDDIMLAYTQRDRLRALRGDDAAEYDVDLGRGGGRYTRKKLKG